jgi:hypothetical protein
MINMHDTIRMVLHKAPAGSGIKRLEEWINLQKKLSVAWTGKYEDAEAFFYEIYGEFIAADDRHEGMKIGSVSFMHDFLEEYATKFMSRLPDMKEAQLDAVVATVKRHFQSRAERAELDDLASRILLERI